VRLVEFNWKPTDRQLREFGVGALVLLPLAGWMATGRPLSFEAMNRPLMAGLVVAGAVLCGLGFVFPKAVKPIFLGLSLAAFPIGLVVSELVLVVIYFGLFLPVSLVFRLIGRDALDRKFDATAASYWTRKRQREDVSQYFRQF
jgi:hypothetical protein